jgi:hypothetical protein
MHNGIAAKLGDASCEPVGDRTNQPRDLMPRSPDSMAARRGHDEVSNLALETFQYLFYRLAVKPKRKLWRMSCAP